MYGEHLEQFARTLRDVLEVRGLNFYDEGYEKEKGFYQPFLGVSYHDRLGTVLAFELALGIQIDLTVCDELRSGIWLDELYRLFYQERALAL